MNPDGFRPEGEDRLRSVLASGLPWIAEGEVFSVQALGAGPFPCQGWKLHVSATPSSAVAVLERALPVLLGTGTRFKVVNRLDRLRALNRGQYGTCQVGKFITVYPSDDATGVALAVALDNACEGLSGPRVPTDRPLRPGSLVHYRYGAFESRSPETGHDLLDGAGRLAVDERPLYYVAPEGIADPFEAASVYVAPARRVGALAGRYLIHEAIYRSWRGGVYRALDLAARPVRVRLLKEAWHDVGSDVAGGDVAGGDARDWAGREAALLARHDGDPHLPRFYDRYDVDGNTYVALEYVEGSVLTLPASGLAVDEWTVLARGAADALAHLHAIGIVFCDFKPEHLIRTPSGGLRLVDFGMAYEPAVDAEPLRGGTVLYAAPEQWEGSMPDPRVDVFSWGAVLHALACGPAAVDAVVDRPWPRLPVRTLRPSFPAALAAVVDRALAWDPADRFPSMGEAQAALDSACSHGAGPKPAAAAPAASDGDGDGDGDGDFDPLAWACEIGDELCAAAKDGGGGLWWETRGPGMVRPDLYDGVAGITLFLAALAQAAGVARYADAARGGGRWLAGPVWARGRAAHGLHCGEGGVGLVLLRLAALLDEPGWAVAASLRARRLAGVPFPSADLLTGAAGTAVFLAELGPRPETPLTFAAARAAGDWLLEHGLTADSGLGGWSESPHSATDRRAGGDRTAQRSGSGAGRSPRLSAPSANQTSLLGAAHGVAGAGLGLTALYRATGDDRYAMGATAAAEVLVAESVRAPDGSWRWPAARRGRDIGFQTWCHGAGGIGQFLVRLGDPRHEDAVRGAAATVGAEARTRTVTGLCCGLAGDASYLLDCGDVPAARACAHRLRQTPPETLDLMQGRAGIGALYLRLARPEAQPDLVLGTALQPPARVATAAATAG